MRMISHDINIHVFTLILMMIFCLAAVPTIMEFFSTVRYKIKDNRGHPLWVDLTAVLCASAGSTVIALAIMYETAILSYMVLMKKPPVILIVSSNLIEMLNMFILFLALYASIYTRDMLSEYHFRL